MQLSCNGDFISFKVVIATLYLSVTLYLPTLTLSYFQHYIFCNSNLFSSNWDYISQFDYKSSISDHASRTVVSTFPCNCSFLVIHISQCEFISQNYNFVSHNCQAFMIVFCNFNFSCYWPFISLNVPLYLTIANLFLLIMILYILMWLYTVFHNCDFVSHYYNFIYQMTLHIATVSVTLFLVF